MLLRTGFALILLLGVATAAPVAEDDRLIVTNDIYPEQYVIYSGEHEIVNLIVPLNDLNYGDNADKKYLFFFVEADTDESGNRIERGLYVFKDGSARKLLDNGRDVAAPADDSKDAFIAADDGIYLYNDETVSVEKYGSVSDNIIGIAKPSERDIIYILTEDKEVFVVSENGEKKERVNEIVNAEQIILDNYDNLYYLNGDKEVYVYDTVSVKKIDGIPQQSSSARLLKPPITSDGIVPFVVDDNLYLINNGRANIFDKIEFAPDGKPSAYAMEAGLMHYYAKDNKIYEFDIYDILYVNGFKGLLGRVVNKYISLGDELIALLGFLNLV